MSFLLVFRCAKTLIIAFKPFILWHEPVIFRLLAERISTLDIWTALPARVLSISGWRFIVGATLETALRATISSELAWRITEIARRAIISSELTRLAVRFTPLEAPILIVVTVWGASLIRWWLSTVTGTWTIATIIPIGRTLPVFVRALIVEPASIRVKRA